MKIKDVIKAVRTHRGKIMAGVLIHEQTVYVQVVKSDLLDVLNRLSDDQVVWSEHEGVGYIDNP